MVRGMKVSGMDTAESFEGLELLALKAYNI
jgi:hypothetical protein